MTILAAIGAATVTALLLIGSAYLFLAIVGRIGEADDPLDLTELHRWEAAREALARRDGGAS